MEIRELVRFKKGVGGLEPPMNIGILLDREKEGPDHVAVLFTLKGVIRVGWKNLKDGLGTVYQGSKADEKAMTGLLRGAVEKERGRNLLRMEPKQIEETVSPMDLWRSVTRYIESGGGGKGRRFPSDPPEVLEDLLMTAEEIGSVHFEPSLLDPRQIGAVGKVLAGCDPVTDGPFARSTIDGQALYAPYKKGTLRAIDAHIQVLRGLKARFVEVVDEQVEAGSERTRKVARRVAENVKGIVLGAEEERLLRTVLAWSISFLENGRWPDKAAPLRHSSLGDASPFGLAGTPIRRHERFDLEEFISLFALDVSGSRRRDLPSDLLSILLQFGTVSWKEASDLVIDHRIASGAQRFHRVFPAHVLAAARSLPDRVEGRDLSGREDLRHLETYTIDPPDAKDFDDAISAERSGDDIIIWVHIADVSHYVKPHDLIDGEARFRATSVYLPGEVLPMLPPELSENICSLKAGAPRLALSTRLRYGPDMTLLESSHHLSVIEVRENLSYGEAEERMDKGEEPFVTLLKASRLLAEKGGRLSLETPERRVRFISDDSISIELKRPTKATMMIEELMVAANECAARALNERGLPTLYRVHPLPDKEAVKKLNGTLEALSLPVRIDIRWGDGGKDAGSTAPAVDDMMYRLLSGGKLTLGSFGRGDEGDDEGGDDSSLPEMAPMDPVDMDAAVAEMNKALSKMRSLVDSSTFDMLQVRLLRTLPRAFYSDSNLGHFGLRSLCYCHFTSPIRRYPDLMVHRSLKALLANEGGCPPVGWDMPTADEVATLIEGVNLMSRAAEDWEREMVDVALATRMLMEPSSRGNAERWRLVSLTPSTAFFQIADLTTEGRIPLSALSPYRVSLDESESRIVLSLRDNPDVDRALDLVKKLGPTGETELMRLGEWRRCTVRSISLYDGRIDLSLAE